MTLKNKAILSGVGESQIGLTPGKTALDLCAEASLAAMDDAGLKPGDIGGLMTAYTSAPYFVFYGALAEQLGLQLDTGATLTAGGGTPGVMLRQAALLVAAGITDNILVVAGDNRATGLGTQKVVQMLAAFGHPIYEDPYGATIPSLYALVAQRYLSEYGLDRSHLAPIAVQSRANATLHPNAHKKDPLRLEDVLNARPISEPLHLFDCCLISDGAGAFIVSRPDRANDLPHRPAWLAGIGERFTHEHLIAAESLTHSGATESARQAFEMAGLQPKDVDFAQLYDCFTITPVLLAEELGLTDPGEGWTLWQDGHAGVKGQFPINTHGGMLSHCHAGAAGGHLNIVECVRQLRGDQGARQVGRHDIGLSHVEGGIMSNHTTTILTREAL